MKEIAPSFGLDLSNFVVERIGDGHIHETYKLKGSKSYILQRVNKNVFKEPGIIACNLRIASEYLSRNFPEYNFVKPIPALDYDEMVYDGEGFPWRLFSFIENTFTINKVDTAKQAFNASSEFGKLTRYLDEVEVREFKETIPDFHNLSLRYQQFQMALAKTSTEREDKARELIKICQSCYPLVEQYESLIKSGSLRTRITHNDTKINNVLLDKNDEGVAVIDLDTLMPGYFIYDLGDMIRTFVPAVSEEEKDLSKITFRKEIYNALLDGYLSWMGDVMTEGEMKAIAFSGKMMTYIMALRFLADYLNGDTYYHTIYPEQNLVRAGNQFKFLELLISNN